MTIPSQPRVPRGVTAGGQFSTGAKQESTVALADASVRKDEPYGGYRLTKVRRMRGREGTAYSGVLAHNGKPIADVIQDGNGGSTLIRFRDGQHGAAAYAFRETVAAHQWSEWEPEEAFVDRLDTVDQMNRKRTIAFILEGDDFWGTGPDHTRWGVHRQARAGISLAELVRHLSGPGYEGKCPRVWVPERGDFVPVEQLAESLA